MIIYGQYEAENSLMLVGFLHCYISSNGSK